jgi:hypothetical protein
VNSDRLRRWLLLAAALICAAGAGLVSVRSIDDQIAVLEACEAVEQRDWQTALARSQGRVGNDDTGRAAAECRCLALLATDDADACVELLERAVADGREDGWAPRPELSIHLIQTWRSQARSDAAAELASRAARRFPGEPDLFYLELETRSGIEDDEVVLKDLAARVPERGPQAVRMRVSLANRQLFRGDFEAALEALGEQPPADAGANLGSWFDARGFALASAGDSAATIANYDDWKRAGGDPIEAAARYALAMSIAGLADPSATPVELLRGALANGDRLADPKLREALAIRLILTLANGGSSGEALAAYDRFRPEFDLAGLTREELMRSSSHRELAASTPERRAGRSGRVRFTLRDPEPGAQLLVSPKVAEPVDTPFAAVAIPASGGVEIEREIGTAPVRWVYRDAHERTLASGNIQPVAGSPVEVTVVARAPKRPTRTTLTRRPGDGRRRVILLLVDCGDWRLVEALRARGELPTLDALLTQGHRAVLDSDPPLTAAALEALVWPNRRNAASFVGLMHQMGTELAGLSSVGENPLDGLRWLLPEEPDIFSVLGRGDHAAANLLLAHGSIRAGRHSEVTGPFGRTRKIPIRRSARDLRLDERERFPVLAQAATLGRDAQHIRTIAAEFDTAEEIVVEGSVDLLALRIEPFDILTHAHFAETVRDGQDDGAPLLYDVYRYVDARIADVHARIDADDVFIVMSDHGIRTAMEHSPHGIFVATGPGIPQGRAAGRPALRGVSSVLANLLGVAADWPDTGVAPWSTALKRAPGAEVAADASPAKVPPTRATN